MAVIERILATLKNGFGLIGGKFKDLLIGFGKIYALIAVFLFIGMLIALGINYLLVLVFPLITLLSIIIVIMLGVIALGIGLSSHSFMNDLAKGKEFNLFETIKKDALRNALYVVVIAVPIIIGYVIAVYGQMRGGIEGILIYLIGYVVIFAWIFITQFSSWEYIIGRKGVLESIGSSFSAVVKNLVFVIPMDIILVIVMWVVQIAMSIIFGLIWFALMIGLLGGVGILYYAEGGQPLSLLTFTVGGIILFLIMASAIVAFCAIQETFFKPIYYYTWVEVGNKK